MRHLYLSILLSFLSMAASAQVFYVDNFKFQITEADVVSLASQQLAEYQIGDVRVPDSVVYQGKTYQVMGLANSCFLNCTDMTSVTLPEGMTSLGVSCFENCTSLKSISIPNSVSKMESNCFNNWHVTSFL